MGFSATGNLVTSSFFPLDGQSSVTGNGSAIGMGDFVLAVVPVPEPSSLLLAGTAALAGLGFWVRRRSC
jgi:PEP-CTERM motif